MLNALDLLTRREALGVMTSVFFFRKKVTIIHYLLLII